MLGMTIPNPEESCLRLDLGHGLLARIDAYPYPPKPTITLFATKSGRSVTAEIAPGALFEALYALAEQYAVTDESALPPSATNHNGQDERD